MGLKDITDPEAVNRAIAEFDTLGRETFLKKYGFGYARAYYVEHNGEQYDSKALIGVAHKYEFPDQGPLASSDFKGGEAATARKFRDLGFTVVYSTPDPDAVLLDPERMPHDAFLTSEAPDAPDPRTIMSRSQFASSLSALRLRANVTTIRVARNCNISANSVANYLSGKRLPRSPLFRGLLNICGVTDEGQIELWMQALSRARNSSRKSAGKGAADQVEDSSDLLFRVYIPTDRLYAAEADRLLTMFSEWMAKIRGHGVRQSGYITPSGKVYEFMTDVSAGYTDLRQEFDQFSSFLALCSQDPRSAGAVLASSAQNVSVASGTALVDHFGKEVRRLEIDLRHERERRMLSIRQDLEERFMALAVDLRTIPISQLNAAVESLVPYPGASESLALLANPWSTQSVTPVTVNINPQIINAAENTIIQNIRGNLNLRVEAKSLLDLIERFGGQDSSLLQNAVYELEDTRAPRNDRAKARTRIKEFLSQIPSTAGNIGVDLLEKYLEHRLGLGA